MFGWFSSKPKKSETWTSVEHMIQELSHRAGGNVRNLAVFSERNFRLFIPVIEKSGGQWAVYSSYDSRFSENEISELKYVTLIGVQGKPVLMLELIQQSCGEGTQIYFIEMERACSYQLKIIGAASRLAVGEEEEFNLPILDAFDAMDLLIDYPELYSLPENTRCTIERFRCSSNSILNGSFYEREWYKGTISDNVGREVTVCFEVYGLRDKCMVRRISEIPEGTYRSENVYKKIKVIN